MVTTSTPADAYRSGALIAGVVTIVAILSVGLLLVAGPLEQSSSTTGDNVSEPAVEYPVPEPGDEWFEAEAADGSWISYINPRDEYRSPYLGDGSGKICVTLLNEAGDPILGESVPNTTVTVPTGESLEWHTGADPMTVQYPLTDHYERPLDADQFGTTDELPQGDGYLDSHCIEIHGMPDDGGTVEYGEATVTGEHAEDIELVGYIQQDGQSWDTDVDPIADAVSYEEAGGGWVYEPAHSHGQAVVVFQLTGDASNASEGTTDDGSGSDDSSGGADDDSSDGSGGDSTDGTDDDSSSDSGDDSSDGTDDDSSADESPANETADDGGDGSERNSTETADDSAQADDGLAGFDTIVTIVALGAIVVASRLWTRRSGDAG